MTFMTEKEIEAQLQTETRTLTLPDGSKRAFHGTKRLWENHDWLLQFDLTSEDIVAMAVTDGEEMNRPFDLSFTHVVGYITTRYRRELHELR